MEINTRYAQAKAGQRMHIVPSVGGDYNLANVALCGKHVDHWRMTSNMPLANCCHNCMRIDRLDGYQRALKIIRDVIMGQG